MTTVVYGATGWTGTLVARALERRGQPLVLAGRDAAQLQRLRDALPSRPALRVAPLDDPTALASAFCGARVVVSCVGPYVDFGEPVLAAALRAGCHYLDASGEHGFLRGVHERYDAAARDRGLTFCPGLAAKGALGDWGATAAAATLPRAGPLDEVAIAYAHGLREYFRPSAGSVLSAAGQGFLRPHDLHDPRRSLARRFCFPPPFDRGYALLVPGAEDVSIPRHMRVGAVRSYLSLAPGSPANGPWALACAASLPWVPSLSAGLRLARGPLEAVLGTPREGRDRDTFAIAVEVHAAGRSVRMGIATRDAYVVTADIIAHGVAALLTHGAAPGVIAPSELCDARAALAALTRGGSLRVMQWKGDA